MSVPLKISILINFSIYLKNTEWGTLYLSNVLLSNQAKEKKEVSFTILGLWETLSAKYWYQNSLWLQLHIFPNKTFHENSIFLKSFIHQFDKFDGTNENEILAIYMTSFDAMQSIEDTRRAKISNISLLIRSSSPVLLIQDSKFRV